MSNIGTAAMASPSSSPVLSFFPGSPARWFFTAETLHEKNQSLRSGITSDKELLYRQQAASFIYDLGTRLHLPQWVINVAVVYMHRFYVFHSFKRFYKNDIAAAALFLAAKVEEMPRKLEHVVKMAYRLQHRDDPELDTSSGKYMEESHRIATYENVLLQTLGFDLNVQVPNTFVVKRIQTLNAPKSLAFAAYHFTTDSLHLTTMCLRYRPSVVASACILLACKWAKWEISSRDGRPWYAHLDPEVTPDVLEALANELVNAFEQCPDRLRNKRHLATVKRDANGVVVPSSVMVDRQNGDGIGNLADLDLLVPTPTSFAPRRFDSLPTKAIPPTVASVSNPSAGGGEQLRPDHRQSSTPVKPILTSEASSSIPSSGPVQSPSTKPRPETSKVDLRSYKERMKDRKMEKSNGAVENACGGSSISQRKSFIPDMSMVWGDSWVDEKKEEKDQQSSSQKSIDSRSGSPRTDKRGQCSSGDRTNHRNGRKRSRRSPTEFHIAFDSKRRPKVDIPGPTKTSSPLTAEDGSGSIKTHSKSDAPMLDESKCQSAMDLQSATTTMGDRKLASDDGAGQCGLDGGGLMRNMPRVIDYEHGARTAIDYVTYADTTSTYEGRKIVTDYKHGSAKPQICYTVNNDTRHDDTDGTSAGSLSSFLSSTSFNSHWSTGERETNQSGAVNGLALAATNEDKAKSMAKNDRERIEKELRKKKSDNSLDKARAIVGGDQTIAADRHFHSIGQHLRKAMMAKANEIADADCEDASAVLSVSSLVGVEIPDDSVLRQAARKAEQMQKLDKLKKMQFSDTTRASSTVQASTYDFGSTTSDSNWSQQTKNPM